MSAAPKASLEDTIAKLDGFARETPTAEAWSEFWTSLLFAADLGPVQQDRVLAHLAELKVGGKRPLTIEWKKHQGDQAHAQQERDASARREMSTKESISLHQPEEQVIKSIEQVLVVARDPELPLMRDLNDYVRPYVDRPEWGRSRNGLPVPTIAMLVPHTESSLRWGIDRHIDLELGGRQVKADEWATRLLENPLPSAPRVRGLVTHPLVRADGRLIDQPGLDSDSELYLHLGGKLGQAPPFIQPPLPIPDDPVEAQGLAAIYALEMLALYDDYRFESEVDRVVALAARLSVLTRKDLDIAPCYLLVGPERGTGKTTLAAIDHVIATGHDIPAASLEDDSEKAKQTLFATFASSPAAVLFDNLEANVAFGSDVLAQSLTKGFVETRRFHSQTNVKANTNTQLYFTGNAITLNEDLQARTLEVRFAAERPTKWSHPDWLSYARSIREEVRVKLQFIQRAFIRHGQHVSGVYTRFPAWAERVRDPLLWAGLPDVGARLQELEDRNPNRLVDAGIVAELQRHFSSVSFTAGQLATELGNDALGCLEALRPLRAMIQERWPRALGKNGAQYLGQYFREHLRRWLRAEDGPELRLLDKPSHGVNRWQVETRT